MATAVFSMKELLGIREDHMGTETIQKVCCGGLARRFVNKNEKGLATPERSAGAVRVHSLLCSLAFLEGWSL